MVSVLDATRCMRHSVSCSAVDQEQDGVPRPFNVPASKWSGARHCRSRKLASIPRWRPAHSTDRLSFGARTSRRLAVDLNSMSDLSCASGQTRYELVILTNLPLKVQQSESSERGNLNE